MGSFGRFSELELGQRAPTGGRTARRWIRRLGAVGARGRASGGTGSPQCGASGQLEQHGVAHQLLEVDLVALDRVGLALDRVGLEELVDVEVSGSLEVPEAAAALRRASGRRRRPGPRCRRAPARASTVDARPGSSTRRRRRRRRPAIGLGDGDARRAPGWCEQVGDVDAESGHEARPIEAPRSAAGGQAVPCDRGRPAGRRHQGSVERSREPLAASSAGVAAAAVVLVEERVDVLERRPPRPRPRAWSSVDLEPLAALLHGLHRPVEHDLERGELLVDVVLGLVPQPPGLGLGVVDGLLGDPAGLARRPRCAPPSARPGPGPPR